MAKLKTDVIIIGAGPVGLFAIFQAGMLGMRCHVIENLPFTGGQCNALYPEKTIYDIPGYPKITAQYLIQQLVKQSEPFKPTYHFMQQAIHLQRVDNNYFQVTTSKNIKIQGKVVIIAGGSGVFEPNKPPLKNIALYEEKSIFYAIKNVKHFSKKTVLIAGGGDSAVDWALSLSEIAEKIYLVHRREKFRCITENFKRVQKLAATGKVELVTPYHLDKLVGNNRMLSAVIVRDSQNNTKKLNIDYLLVFFGLKMNLNFIKNWSLDIERHHIKVDNIHYQTNLSGVYAVGDIAIYPGKLKLILVGFAEVTSALHHAYNKVFNKVLHFQHSTNTGIPKL